MTDTVKGRGFRTFEELRADGIIETGDIIISPYYNKFLGKRSRIRNMHHWAVTDSSYYLAICGNPYNLTKHSDGASGYRLALERKPWQLIKKAQVSEFQKIDYSERCKIRF
ncbi:MAG: hypothetical protein HYW23_02245 [Candidatus Aenigmarchaeota archaeon]|nr:hypothetical protein [Candidatus Aenigmarchaeota archaeon]